MPLILSALASGLLFGLGLIVSQMVNPAKVLGFLDVFGDWDPSLAFVMGGAVAVSASAPSSPGGAVFPSSPAGWRSRPAAISIRACSAARRSSASAGVSSACAPAPRSTALTFGPWQVLVFVAGHDRRHGAVPARAIQLAAGHLPARTRGSDR